MSVRMLSRQPSPSPAAASTSSAVSSESPTFPVAVSPSPGSASGSGNGLGLPSTANSGVVVVGAVGRVEADVAQLLDRILDAQVFVGEGRGGDGEEEKERRNEVRVPHESGREERQFYVSGRGRRLEGTTGLREPDTSDVRRADSQLEEETAVKLAGGERVYGPQRRKDGFKSKSSQLERIEGDAVEAKFGETGDVGKDRESRKLGSLQSKLKHYYDEEKGVVYVQFIWGSLPLDSTKLEDFKVGAKSAGHVDPLDHVESEGLRGLLFMFSVCHVILFVQEGAHFDPRHLRTFRLLQSAKHSLAPFVKSQVLPGLIHSSSGARSSPLRPVSLASSNSSGRNGATGRHTSIIALMSGSAPILFPGQCTPVILFVFLEDSIDSSASPGRPEDVSESLLASAQPSQSSFVSQLVRHALQPKPVISSLTRTGSKSEVGFRKKVQTAVENQVRFLLKKCRTVATAGDPGPLGSGVGSGMGPRGPGSGVSNLAGGAGGGALFVLDPSRAVVLVDKSSNRSGDALDSITEAMEDLVDGKVSSEEAIWELAGKSSPAGDEIHIIKDFLSRQAEILRGRGGISNSSAGGSAGVGMVAAAAAAAAASAAAGSAAGSGGGSKPLCTPPELPSIATWLAACRLIAEALSAAEGRAEDGTRGSSPKIVEGSRAVLKKSSPGLIISGRGVLGIVQNKGSVELAIACLEGGSDLDLKFSAAWCKRVLPSAREVYLKGLPPCYPTSLHKAQLEKAIRAFCNMVRGPAVSVFVAKLRHDCETVWTSGRQLCDAQSLTGKPCIHQVHEVSETVTTGKTKGTTRRSDLQEKKQETAKSIATGKENPVHKPHSSGVVFLHACACGRSRKLREDPFNFESANVTFFQFPNCENMLPSFVLPDCEASKPLGGASWSLTRLGNAQYYDPAAGLLQSGFCAKLNILALWELALVYCRLPSEAGANSEAGNMLPENLPAATRKPPSVESKNRMQADISEPRVSSSNHKKPITKLSSTAKRFPDEPKMGFSRAVSSGPDMKKAPVELNLNLNFFADPAFPPLPQRNERQPPATAFKSGKGSGRDKKDPGPNIPTGAQLSGVVSNITTGPRDKKTLEHPERVEESGVQSIFMPLPSPSPKAAALATKTDYVRMYIGFEHECPYGHRFFLSVEHLSRLGPPYVQVTSQLDSKPENGAGLPKPDMQEQKFVQLKSGKKHILMQGHTPTDAASVHGFSDSVVNKAPDSGGDTENFVIRESSGEGHALLGANLPIFMNCPYCEVGENQQNRNDGVTFAGTVSQLQRIFLVTPPLPLLLASCPVVEFEESYGYARKHVKESLKFSLGCELVLPPDSFLSLRLPFVYFTESEDGKREPLLYKKDKPEQTAWLVKGSSLFTLTKADDKVPAG